MKIKVEALGEAIVKAMKELTTEAVKKINAATEPIAKKYVTQLKRDAPKRSGRYAKGWKVSVGTGERGLRTSEIYNPKHYRLTHLLEKGHQLRQGGRAKARPHFISIEENVHAEFEKEVEKILDNLW